MKRVCVFFGVIPEVMVSRGVAHHGGTELRIVHSTHDRKAMMANLSDALVLEDRNPDQLLDRLAGYTRAGVQKWIVTDES